LKANLGPKLQIQTKQKSSKIYILFLKLEDLGKPQQQQQQQSKITIYIARYFTSKIILLELFFCLKDTTKKSWVWTLKIKRPFFRGQEQPFYDLTSFFVLVVEKVHKNNSFLALF